MPDTRIPPGTIVVGVDSAPGADEALGWAIQEAACEQTPLTLVHSIGEAVSAWVDLPVSDFRDIIDATAAAGHEVIGRARAEVERIAPGLEVHELLRFTGSHQALMDLSDDSAMIVVGSRFAGPADDPQHSSAVDFVTAQAGCPVVVPRRRRTLGMGVVVLCDGSPDSREVLAYAWGQADRRSLPLTVVHCLPDPAAHVPERDIALMDATARMEATMGPSLLGFERILLGDLVREMRTRWPGVDARVVVDDVAIDHCLETARTTADMLVAGAHHARRVSEMVMGWARPDEVECVTVVLPMEERGPVTVPVLDVDADIDATRLLLTRLHGSAHRLVGLGVPPEQAVAELRSITDDPAVLAEAAVRVLGGWGAGRAKPWQTPQVAEMLVRAAGQPALRAPEISAPDLAS